MLEQCSRRVEHRATEAVPPGFKSWLCLSLASDLGQPVAGFLQLLAPFDCSENNVS